MRATIGRPVTQCSVTLDFGEKLVRDDGYGRLCGDGEGTIDYSTGKFEVNFHTKPKVPYRGFLASYDAIIDSDDLFIPVVNKVDVSGMSVHAIMQMLSDHSCPVCGRKTYLQDADQFGCVRVDCPEHGSFSLQRG